MGNPTLSIILPAKNEAEGLRGTLPALKLAYPEAEIIVVDDGSSDATAQVAAEHGARVLSSPYSMGNGAAIKRGARAATGGVLVFMDADGQHDPADIDALLQPLAAGQAEVVIGAFPDRASRARHIAWSYFRGLTGLRLEDITSGFRAYNHAAMTVLASREASLLDYQDVGVLLILRRQGLRIVEAPVAMQPRAAGASRVFRSWWVVGKYMLQTSLLCLARVGSHHAPTADD